MESILSIHEEVYPLKTRHRKSLSYLSNPHIIKIYTLNNRINTVSLIYQYIKRMMAQRSLYILGLFNLILAGIAILCVIQAEDHPEYFSLVYITISIFIFYMATIIFIIILQIIETYRERHKKNSSSLSIEIPLLTPKLITQTNPILVESIMTKTQAKTRLSRSHTLPSTPYSLNSSHTLSNSMSSSTRKNTKQRISMPSSHLELLPKYHESIINLPKDYQSFSSTTNDQLYQTYNTITNNDTNSHLSSLIKPIPFKYHRNIENNKQKYKFSE
ncbi:unnamed protein product [Rotaria sordida]|uniref:Uncharacterized protein n=1 Tax=Rotaria sordida TaxID=392033 RepID=A0A818KDN2_9BILA|nr:unnamed protein product [Rotaria sordida]CAF0907066.1 unnamed protein product [Rotaria sordida]CAF3553595.1 unnamed protein product [Rotaria sordida]CAF3858207.1 unnamed protein product [Rotaria sordida]